MSLWKWNDVELEVDMEDFDFLQKYEDAFKKLEIEEKEVVKTGTGVEIIRNYCNLFYHLFDRIFGEGTSNRLFAGKRNIRLCEECYDSFIRHCSQQTIAANQRRSEILRKYKPNDHRKGSKGKKYNKHHYSYPDRK